MKNHLFKTLGLAVVLGLVAGPVLAQEKTEPNELNEQEEIVIKPESGKDTKVTVEINDGDVKINGKPLSEFDEEGVSVRKRSAREGRARLYAPGSPFRGGTTNFDSEFFGKADANKAFLGVLTQQSENGAKISNVTKGSAADKAGLKEGDVITRIGDTKVSNPRDLIEAVGKLKPEQNVTITYQRDKREQKAKATLGKRPGDVAYFNHPDFKFDNQMDFNFDDKSLFNYLGAGAKLGIKAQDTEDGKGVAVVDVDEGSNAEKAGIKEGDILTEFDGREVNSAPALADAARDARDKSSIKVKLNRNGKSQEIEIKVPKKLKTATL